MADRMLPPSRADAAPPERLRVLAKAALRILAAAGTRGLTHRAVDVEAGLPPGSVNYYVKTREQLLSLCLGELFRHDYLTASTTPPSGPITAADLPGALAGLVVTLSAGKALLWQRSRQELLLEAQRRPEFLAQFEQQRLAFIDLATSTLTGTGCSAPERHAEPLVAFIDGLIARQVFYPRPLSRAQVRDAFVTHLSGC